MRCERRRGIKGMQVLTNAEECDQIVDGTLSLTALRAARRQNMKELDALSLEYQRDYGTASRDLNVFDLVNNPTANGICRVFGLRRPEETSDSAWAEIGVLRNYRADSLLVTKDPL